MTNNSAYPDDRRLARISLVHLQESSFLIAFSSQLRGQERDDIFRRNNFQFFLNFGEEASFLKKSVPCFHARCLAGHVVDSTVSADPRL